jgi:hypothetical protein
MMRRNDGRGSITGKIIESKSLVDASVVCDDEENDDDDAKMKKEVSKELDDERRS